MLQTAPAKMKTSQQGKSRIQDEVDFDETL
jgi:hypothetical protein